MLPDAARFHSSDVWEVTRFCIDESVSSCKNSLVNKATLALSLAISEYAHVKNIREVVAISQRYLFSMSSVLGPKAEIISSKIESDGTEILCGA
jgi:N-acyl-L-homoserine lactone synthetase